MFISLTQQWCATSGGFSPVDHCHPSETPERIHPDSPQYTKSLWHSLQFHVEGLYLAFTEKLQADDGDNALVQAWYGSKQTYQTISALMAGKLEADVAVGELVAAVVEEFERRVGRRDHLRAFGRAVEMVMEVVAGKVESGGCGRDCEIYGEVWKWCRWRVERIERGVL